MPKVNIEKECSLAPETVFEKVTKLLETDSELKKLDPSYQCEFHADKLSGTAKGKLFKAHMQVSGSPKGSKVHLVIDLPLTLALAKGLVQKTLSKKLDGLLS